MDLMNRLMERPPFSVPSTEKQQILLDGLRMLTRHHLENCPEYRRLGQAFGWTPESARRVEDLPWLPIGVFKTHRLVSVPENEIYTELKSSGTSGQSVSRVVLDRKTAEMQARALNHIMGEVLGGTRRPMIVVDTRSVLQDPRSFSARGAGVLGMMRFGRRPVFILDDDMNVRENELKDFLHRNAGESVLVFGFTYMIWRYFLPVFRKLAIDRSC